MSCVLPSDPMFELLPTGVPSQMGLQPSGQAVAATSASSRLANAQLHGVRPPPAPAAAAFTAATAAPAAAAPTAAALAEEPASAAAAAAAGATTAALAAGAGRASAGATRAAAHSHMHTPQRASTAASLARGLSAAPQPATRQAASKPQPAAQSPVRAQAAGGTPGSGARFIGAPIPVPSRPATTPQRTPSGQDQPALSAPAATAAAGCTTPAGSPLRTPWALHNAEVRAALLHCCFAESVVARPIVLAPLLEAFMSIELGFISGFASWLSTYVVFAPLWRVHAWNISQYPSLSLWLRQDAKEVITRLQPAVRRTVHSPVRRPLQPFQLSGSVATR